MRHFLNCLLLLCLLHLSCKRGPVANATARYEVSGLCETCPGQRLDTLITRINGVVSVKLTDDSLTVAYDSTLLKPISLITSLNESGYDVDENLSVFPSFLDACCTTRGKLSSSPASGGSASFLPELEDIDFLAGFDADSAQAAVDPILDKEIEANLDDLLQDEVLSSASRPTAPPVDSTLLNDQINEALGPD